MRQKTGSTYRKRCFTAYLEEKKMKPSDKQTESTKDKKVVLAFSGGLDTSFCIPYLKEQGFLVITVYVDSGLTSETELSKIAGRAKELGATKHYNINAADELYSQIVSYLIKTNGLYQGKYPLLCSDRYIIAKKCVEIAEAENAQYVAHGSTGMGNDQVRFDTSISALSDAKIIAPIRDFQKINKVNLRLKEAQYLESKGFSVPKLSKKYTVNENLLGCTISGSEIDENSEPSEDAYKITANIPDAPDKPEYIEMEFACGLPVSLNGKTEEGIEILKKLNALGGKHGVGRDIYTGDCIIGIKGRIAFEYPGLKILLTAHNALEEAILSKEQNRFKETINKKWVELVYSGLYFDPLTKDTESFIDSLQDNVCGSVKIKLHKGNCIPVSYNSINLPKANDTKYAQSSSWSPDEAEGFVKLFGMSTVTSKKQDASQGKT
jgi:argininosuccinate synthase